MINFKELPEDGTTFEQFIREICLIADLHPLWTGKGPDQGRDIVIEESAVGPLLPFSRRWLIQCKHFAHAERSVGRSDLGQIFDDCRQVGATGYLLACSTQPSASLVTKLRELASRDENRLATRIWDAVDLERKLAEPRYFSLGHVFFPRSFEATPWKLYNTGTPNKWAAHFRTYFLHLNSRVSGSYPSLSDCEQIILRLEHITPTSDGEVIRPRAIYFNEKSEEFTVFVDYLVPRAQSPSLSPQDFNAVLRDGDGLYSDHKTMWYRTVWDVKRHDVIETSDHFHLDHYDFYEPFRWNFESGALRRGYTIGELSSRGRDWVYPPRPSRG